jgi:hypothetical protein
MRSFSITFVLAGVALVAQADEKTAAIRADAQKCAEAALKADYDSMVRYTHPRVVRMMGGKDKMIEAVKKSMAQMQQQGAEFSAASVGEPETPKKIGEFLTCKVPEHVVIKIGGGKLESDSMLLGISDDGGKKWTFIDLGPMKKDAFKLLFPELAEKIELPEKKPPTFSKE